MFYVTVLWAWTLFPKIEESVEVVLVGVVDGIAVVRAVQVVLAQKYGLIFGYRPEIVSILLLQSSIDPQ